MKCLTRIWRSLLVDGPEDGEEEEGVLEEEDVAGPHAELGPGREEEVDEEDALQEGLRAGLPVVERVAQYHFDGRRSARTGRFFLIRSFTANEITKKNSHEWMR